jgi:hypothetical protein
MSLNTKQWLLYTYLKEHYSDDKFISKKELAQACGYTFNDKSQRNCVDMEADVRAINDCDIIQKIVVSDSTGYKIGNEAQVLDYLKKRFNRDFKSLRLNWKLAKKVKMNNQMRLVFGSERDTIETFIKTKLEEEI